MGRFRAVIVFGLLAVAIALPIGLAMVSPQLAWRHPVYSAGGFAGVLGLTVLLFQPLVAGGFIPGLSPRRRRVLHRAGGMGLVLLVIAHVGGLAITNAADVADALLLQAPTPFSVWGVLALWAIFLAAGMAVLKVRHLIAPKLWRIAHITLVILITVATSIHALLIEGAMEPVSKALLCAMVLAATGWAVVRVFRNSRAGRTSF